MTLQTTLWNFHTVKNELSTIVFLSFFFCVSIILFPFVFRSGGVCVEKSLSQTTGVLCFLNDLCLVLLIVYSSLLFCNNVSVWLLLRVMPWVWMFGLCHIMHHSTENVYVPESLTQFLKPEKNIMGMLTHVEEAGIPQITKALPFDYLLLMNNSPIYGVACWARAHFTGSIKCKFNNFS